MGDEWIDLTQSFAEGIAHARSLPDPKIRFLKKVGENNARTTASEVTFATHVGTHVDAPLHLFADGKTIDQYPVSRFIGPGVGIELPCERFQPITVAHLEAAKPAIRPGDMVLIHTGWDVRIEDDSYYDHPHLEVEAARWLVDKKVNIVGVDVITVEQSSRFRKEPYDLIIHKILLGNNVLVMEILANLGAVAGHRLTVSALPYKLAGRDGAPARVVARIED